MTNLLWKLYILLQKTAKLSENFWKRLEIIKNHPKPRKSVEITSLLLQLPVVLEQPFWKSDYLIALQTERFQILGALEQAVWKGGEVIVIKVE